MESMNPDTRLNVLRSANAQLANFFGRYSGAPVLGTKEELAALLQVERTLRSVGALLKQGVQESEDRETRDELIIYRANLVRLQRELGDMQDSALASRARLFARQKHLHEAQAWCAASRDTR
jgi:hypothetical protein